MKTKRLPPATPNFEELIPLLFKTWRKWLDLPVGPLDRLQTREFQSVIEALGHFHQEKDYSNKEQIGAYLLYDWILHYVQGLSLLQELPSMPRKVLDLCSGACPFALAALRSGASDVFALDERAELLKLGTEILGKFGYPLSVRQHNCKDLKFPTPQQPWDLIILGYGLFELFQDPASQKSYIQSLLHKLSPEGHLLIVEPSEQKENRRFLALRDLLAENGVSIYAPCIWKGACPALQHGSTVCFAQRPFDKPPIIKDIQRASSIQLSSVKMSYLILKSANCPAQSLPSKPLYRVVSPPIETFRGERLFLCGTEGRKTLGSKLKQHPKHSRAFEYLKRGDLLSVQDATCVRDDLEITDRTVVELIAPCGKPVPEQP
jgi:hypothetical protein